MPRFTGFTADDKAAIKQAVRKAMAVFPNAHLGDQTPREDMHSAFLAIRLEMCIGCGPQTAASNCLRDFARYEDM